MKQELEEALDDVDPAAFLAVKQELLEADDDGNAMMYTYAYVGTYVRALLLLLQCCRCHCSCR